MNSANDTFNFVQMLPNVFNVCQFLLWICQHLQNVTTRLANGNIFTKNIHYITNNCYITKNILVIFFSRELLGQSPQPTPPLAVGVASHNLALTRGYRVCSLPGPLWKSSWDEKCKKYISHVSARRSTRARLPERFITIFSILLSFSPIICFPWFLQFPRYSDTTEFHLTGEM